MLPKFRKPNLSGTRFRPKRLEILNKEFFGRLREAHPHLSMYSDRELKKIVQVTNRTMRERAARYRDGVEFPEQLGFVFVGSSPATKAGNVDYKKSLELGRKVRHQNWDTEGLTCKIYYTNFEHRYRFKFHELWTLEPSKDFRKDVSLVYPARYNYYVRVDNYANVARLFRQRLRDQDQNP